MGNEKRRRCRDSDAVFFCGETLTFLLFCQKFFQRKPFLPKYKKTVSVFLGYHSSPPLFSIFFLIFIVFFRQNKKTISVFPRYYPIFLCPSGNHFFFSPFPSISFFKFFSSETAFASNKKRQYLSFPQYCPISPPCPLKNSFSFLPTLPKFFQGKSFFFPNIKQQYLSFPLLPDTPISASPFQLSHLFFFLFFCRPSLLETAFAPNKKDSICLSLNTARFSLSSS